MSPKNVRYSHHYTSEVPKTEVEFSVIDALSLTLLCHSAPAPSQLHQHARAQVSGLEHWEGQDQECVSVACMEMYLLNCDSF